MSQAKSNGLIRALHKLNGKGWPGPKWLADKSYHIFLPTDSSKSLPTCSKSNLFSVDKNLE
jgi:hypothetical protein